MNKTYTMQMTQKKLSLFARTTAKRSIFGFFRGATGERLDNGMWRVELQWDRNPKAADIAPLFREHYDKLYPAMGIRDTLHWIAVFVEALINRGSK